MRAIPRSPRQSAIARTRPTQLSDLYRRRDELDRRTAPGNAALGPNAATGADLDKQISDAQAALADADAALQAASPNYGQLVQQVVPAKDVFAALHPNEAFVALTLSDDDGWVFLLRNGSITVSRIDAGLKQVGRTGAPRARRHRADHRRPADLRHCRCADTVPAHAGQACRIARRRDDAGRGAGGPAAVAAVRGAADRPGRRLEAGRRAVAGAQVHHRACAGAVQLRLAAQDRRRLPRTRIRGLASATSIR